MPTASTLSQTVPFFDLQRQGRRHLPDWERAIGQVLSRGDFILGQAVEDFERDFAEYLGTRHAVGVGNGLDALRLSLTALEIGPGAEVIVPANTFIATALAVTGVGAKPVFVDCDPYTYNLCPDRVAAAITSRTRAIIPVHLMGLPAPMQEIGALAEKHSLHIVEDVAHAPGATYHGKACGSLGDAGCFSFYPSKNLGALGDGGAVATNDDLLAQRLRLLRNYGQEQRYMHTVLGLNSRLDTLQAAVLRQKLPLLDQWNAARTRLVAHYKQRLEGIGDLTFQRVPAHSTHVFHLLVVETSQRDPLMRHLATKGIETRVHYPLPLPFQPAFADLGHQPGDFPVAQQLAQAMLSLPLFPEMEEDEVESVCDVIENWFAIGAARNE